MNILILTSWYPSKKNLVSGIFVKEQIKALKCLGLNPVVFYPFDTSIKPNSLTWDLEDGVKVYRANTDYIKNSKLSKINSFMKSVRFLNKVVKENNIELIHSHVCYGAGFIANLYTKFNNIPYIITEHMSTIKEFSLKPYNRILFKSSYKRAKKVITVSSFLSNELTSLGYQFHKEIIGNVVNVDEYELNYSKENDIFNILFIGIMGENEVKGLPFFIPALAKFMCNNPQYNIKFHLIGDGIKRKKYESLCNEYKISQNCIFYGAVDKKDIPRYIKNSSFLVLPSVKETFGSVLIEAMAGGKPVLATKCGGPQEFVNKKVGVLVDSKSEEALEEGLKKIIENYDKFDTLYIRNYIKNNYSYEAVGSKLKCLYEDILLKSNK
ncbi:putative teichuronic acid biosynthesis glycosyltransferase TuaC [Clostridium acetireducens DSM 10703]|uniref:Putative teichuronic acid biosynthesis glycosyltransferase TuaC n=1 Tax=Clostridium acetireducens DSM 10703 TaxID=1121290 RepID=A0A1E8EXV6_9CLOT|nr:glycosyltransferase [Clostridium acetireducens]OFI05789.1 putative teichuronic acid biosynthesis glycosyltransferase TuaC [Clostridium acetireducens DSM 10703]